MPFDEDLLQFLGHGEILDRDAGVYRCMVIKNGVKTEIGGFSRCFSPTERVHQARLIWSRWRKCEN